MQHVMQPLKLYSSVTDVPKQAKADDVMAVHVEQC